MLRVSASRPPKRTPRERRAVALSDNERPTLVPEFDLEAFARDSEIQQRSALPVDGEASIDQARRCHGEGDHEQALFLLARVTELAPLHPEATSLARDCRAALERECLSAVGSESTVLTVAMTADALMGLALDHVSGFLLSLMDGTLTVEAILDVSGLPRLLALRHLRNLLERGIVSVASGYRRPPVPLNAQSWANREPIVEHDALTVESSFVPSGVRLDAVAALLRAPEPDDPINAVPSALGLLALVDDKRTVREILAIADVNAAVGTALFERLTEEGIVALI
jgi:hypothetical protein